MTYIKKSFRLIRAGSGHAAGHQPSHLKQRGQPSICKAEITPMPV